MTHVPPPWIIDEADRRRRRDERERPRLEIPRPLPPARSGGDEQDPRAVIVVDLLLELRSWDVGVPGDG